MNTSSQRHLGLLATTGLGVGAIVGGGILALAGVAFAHTGPSAMLAFGLNGFIALLTALSFAELSTACPESGGTYTFARKVLSVRTAFSVGWVVWFASILAAVLYAFGFGTFLQMAVIGLIEGMGFTPPAWFGHKSVITFSAFGITVYYTAVLSRQVGGGDKLANVSKITAFGILILGGVWKLTQMEMRDIHQNLTPFFSHGGKGLLLAMGFTFIALQGFDLIAAGAGEVQNPKRTIPRAMIISLLIALGIYLPLLFITATVGISDGQTLAQLSRENPESIIALTARNYLGSTGFWLVVLAGLFSMASALYANLFAASRVASTMAADRILPSFFTKTHKTYNTPANALFVSGFLICLILLLIPNLAIAGAAASLIFLLSFTLAHYIAFLFRRRRTKVEDGFQAPFYPFLPITGIALCSSLALFQAYSVPNAGLIVGFWLAGGTFLYIYIFGSRARAYDAAMEATDPELVTLRGRNPLVLTPISNPENSRSLVETAHALAPPGAGRVLLLTILPENPTALDDPHSNSSNRLRSAKEILETAYSLSGKAPNSPEILATVSSDPWAEIERVSKAYRCESLLLGLSSLSEKGIAPEVESLVNSVSCDAVILGAPDDWSLSKANRILVPVGGKPLHGFLRSRLLGSLVRTGKRTISFLSVISPTTSREEENKILEQLSQLAADEVSGNAQVGMMRHDDVVTAIAQHAALHDLVIIGLQKAETGKKAFGEVALKIARMIPCAVLLISQRE